MGGPYPMSLYLWTKTSKTLVGVGVLLGILAMAEIITKVCVESTGFSCYPQGIGPRMSPNTKIQGCSRLYIKQMVFAYKLCALNLVISRLLIIPKAMCYITSCLPYYLKNRGKKKSVPVQYRCNFSFSPLTCHWLNHRGGTHGYETVCVCFGTDTGRKPLQCVSGCLNSLCN
jgi:hypothetical protein